MPTLADVLRQTGYAQDGTLATPTPTESPMTKALAEHIKSIPQKFNENQAYQMELLGKAFPGNTYESMMTQGDPKAMAELAMQTPFNAMVAYHGTPHNILGKFDINKVGTGEGAQAYGHGMYFAEAKDLADVYRKKLTNEAGNLVKSPNDSIQLQMGNLENQIKQLKQSNDPNAEAMIKAYQNRIDEINKAGNLYKVDIPDEYIPNMLDWDKTISQMSPELQKQIRRIAKEEYLPLEYQNAKKHGDLTGKHFYMEMAKKFDTIEGASQVLNSEGIRGIRYLDEGSRSAGKGTSNFVVFDPSEVKILEKNSKPVSRKELIEEQVNKLKD